MEVGKLYSRKKGWLQVCPDWQLLTWGSYRRLTRVGCPVWLVRKQFTFLVDPESVCTFHHSTSKDWESLLYPKYLGVPSDAVSKKVPLRDGQLSRGEWHSTYQPCNHTEAEGHEAGPGNREQGGILWQERLPDGAGCVLNPWRISGISKQKEDKHATSEKDKRFLIKGESL